MCHPDAAPAHPRLGPISSFEPCSQAPLLQNEPHRTTAPSDTCWRLRESTGTAPCRAHEDATHDRTNWLALIRTPTMPAPVENAAKLKATRRGLRITPRRWERRAVSKEIQERETGIE